MLQEMSPPRPSSSVPLQIAALGRKFTFFWVGVSKGALPSRDRAQESCGEASLACSYVRCQKHFSGWRSKYVLLCPSFLSFGYWKDMSLLIHLNFEKEGWMLKSLFTYVLTFVPGSRSETAVCFYWQQNCPWQQDFFAKTRKFRWNLVAVISPVVSGNQKCLNRPQKKYQTCEDLENWNLLQPDFHIFANF